MPSNGRSILAIHPGALGDLILFGHLLKAIGRPVKLVAGGEKAHLLAGLGAVDSVMDFDSLPMHEIFAEGGHCEKLPSLLGKADCLISCFAADNKRVEESLVRVCGAAEAHFLPVRPPADFPGHLTDLWTQELEIPPLSRQPAPWPLPEDWRRQTPTKNLGDGAYVVMHPGAGSPTKRWPIVNFVELSGRLRQRWDWRTVFAIGPAEQEQFSLSDIESLRQAGPVLTSPPLSILAAFLAGAKAYIGNDSGPSHLSAALGAATVAIFGPTDANHFAPIGRKVSVISANTINCISINQVEAAISQLAKDN